jgi:hypothetical protein
VSAGVKHYEVPNGECFDVFFNEDGGVWRIEGPVGIFHLGDVMPPALFAEFVDDLEFREVAS